MDFALPSGARYILEQLNTAGYEAYLVGGCVRDLLRGVTPHDWDICTQAMPGEIEACFPELSTLETGLVHGTVTLLADHQPFEVTTYRSDGTYSDGRHPDAVAFVTSLTEDLARRDFTVNAMAMSLDGSIQDPFGGRDDLRRGLLRCVGDPDRRFQEDGLRLMRALRFSAVLDFEIEPDTAAALRRNLPMLDKVAAERVRSELCKLLLGPRCVPILREYPQVLCRFWPQLAPLVELEQRNPWHCWGGWEHTLHALAAAPLDLTLRLAVLLHDAGKPSCKTTDAQGIDHFYGHAAVSGSLTDEMLRTLKFDNATRRRVVTLVEHHDAPVHPTEKSIRRWLNRLGEEALFQLLEIKRCDNMGQSPEKVAQRLSDLTALTELAHQVVAQGQCFSLKDLAVDGHDVLAAGVPSGPQVGQTLNALLAAVIAGELPNDKAALLARLATLGG